mmetsp:Transcript_32072/g.35530  ORF Transcript_32072/g.35530 Transcript_32072/m.35530 type:complete len:141 (-) Transcript_32072:65-487(-)
MQESNNIISTIYRILPKRDENEDDIDIAHIFIVVLVIRTTMKYLFIKKDDDQYDERTIMIKNMVEFLHVILFILACLHYDQQVNHSFFLIFGFMLYLFLFLGLRTPIEAWTHLQEYITDNHNPNNDRRNHNIMNHRRIPA